jgi:hypothetical protein
MTQNTEDEVNGETPVNDWENPTEVPDNDMEEEYTEEEKAEQDALIAGAQANPDEPESFDVTIEGFEPEQEETKSEGNWVKELRKRQRELAKENRELKQRLESANVKDERAVVVGEKPTLAGCEFDDEKFERELLAWNDRKQSFESQKQQKQQAEEQAQRSFQEKLAKYGEERKAIPVDDYEDAEEAVQSALNEVQIGILIKNAPEKAKLVYAIGKNDKALQHLAAIKDPDTYAVELGRIIERMKSNAAPKKSIPAPERVVRSGGGNSSAATSGNLQKELDSARKNEDYDAVIQIKRRAREAGLTLD